MASPVSKRMFGTRRNPGVHSLIGGDDQAGRLAAAFLAYKNNMVQPQGVLAQPESTTPQGVLMQPAMAGMPQLSPELLAMIQRMMRRQQQPGGEYQPLLQPHMGIGE